MKIPIDKVFTILMGGIVGAVVSVVLAGSVMVAIKLISIIFTILFPS